MDTTFDIKFSTNWAGKLNADVFSTLRIHNHHKHFVGNKAHVKFKDTQFTAEVIEVTLAQIEKLPNFVFLLDTGYSKEEAIKMFKNMYKHYDIAIEACLWSLLILKKI